MRGAEFTDPRLVALYDQLNPLARGSDFYLKMAKELRARTVVDVGCGTGLLSNEFAKQGHIVLGLDPAAAMLDAARLQSDAHAVTWMLGDATTLQVSGADLAIMTGHVAQLFLEEVDWRQALTAIHGALRPGGHLIFEIRNPVVERWRRWTKERTLTAVEDPAGNRVTVWTEVLDASRNRIRFEMHYLWEATAEELVSESTIIFRSDEEVRQALRATGFTVERMFGDWDTSAPTSGSPELIYVAKANADAEVP